MATPHSTTDTQEDTDSVDEHEDKPSAARERRSFGRKFLHSKAIQKMAGRKLGGSAVTPAMDKEQSPSRVSVTTSRRPSDTIPAAQSHQGAAAGREKPVKPHSKQQQVEPYPIPPPPGQRDPPPQGPLFQPERPNTSSLVTSTAAEEPVVTHQPVAGYNISGQLLNQPVGYGSNQPPQHLQPAHHGGDPTQSLRYDHLPPQRTTTAVVPPAGPHQPDHTHLEGEQEGDHRHDDPSVGSDQQVQLLELENMRLKREKAATENTIGDYELQIVAKNQEIARLKKAKTSPLPRVPPPTEKDTKLEMSLVDRTAQLTQCTAEKDLLQQELYELQAKYKALEAEKQTATHQVETSTHQAETARKERASLEEEITNLKEQLVNVEREKKELIHSSQEQQLKEKVKQLEDELRGMAAEKKASEEELLKQCQNNQEQLEQLLKTAQEEVQLLKSKPVEQQLRHQLEESNAKVNVLEETKRLIQNDLDKERRRNVAELTRQKEEENTEQRIKVETLEHDLDEEKKKVAEVARCKEEDIAEQRREMETIKQELATAQQKLARATEKKKKYKTKAETLHQQKVQQELAQAMNEKAGNEENETRLQQQLAERNEETRKIKEEYDFRLAELQRQLETRQPKVDDGSQTTGGAGASPLTSLEDKRKTADLHEELTVKDQHLAGLREDLKTRDLLVTELREKLYQEELLSKQLGRSVSHLQSDLKKTSTAKDGLSEEIKILRATLAIKEAELQTMAEDSNEKSGQIVSLADTEEQSSREVLQLREILKEKSSQLNTALQSLERITRVQQTLENEKAQLTHELQEKEKSIDSLRRRLNRKDASHKKELDEADRVHNELEDKLLEQVKQRSELSEHFEALKAQHLKLVQVHSESDFAVNAKQHQLESKQREIVELQTNLGIVQAQAATYREDFLHERRDREAKHEELQNLTEQSAAIINRKETRIAELEKELTQRVTSLATADREKFQQLQEDYQISQSQIIAYKKQMDIGKKELEEERKRVEQRQTRIDVLNSQLSKLTTEKRAASNYQMETTRANRLQDELEHLKAQYKELERNNAQLKLSNQTLLGRLHKARHSPQLDHTPPSGQHHVQPGARPQSEHAQWQQPNTQQAYQDQQEQLYRQQQQELQRREQEQLYRQQQQELQRREQEQLYRQQQQEHQRQEQEQLYRQQQQQEQQRREQEQLYRQQQRQPGAIPYSYEESAGRVGPPQQQQQPPTALPHRFGGRSSYSGDMLLNTNAAPISHSTDSSLPSVVGQQYQHPSHHGGSRTSGHTWRPDQQPTPAQLGAMAGRGRGGGLGRDPVLHQSQLGQVQQKQQQQQPSASPSQAAYSSATAESSSKRNESDTSDVAENPLIEGIDKDMLEAQREVEKMYVEPAESIEGTAHDDSFQIPFDPLLICPKCGRQFRRGEIQKLRKHHDGCQQ